MLTPPWMQPVTTLLPSMFGDVDAGRGCRSLRPCSASWASQCLPDQAQQWRENLKSRADDVMSARRRHASWAGLVEECVSCSGARGSGCCCACLTGPFSVLCSNRSACQEMAGLHKECAWSGTKLWECRE